MTIAYLKNSWAFIHNTNRILPDKFQRRMSPVKTSGKFPEEARSSAPRKHTGIAFRLAFSRRSLVKFCLSLVSLTCDNGRQMLGVEGIELGIQLDLDTLVGHCLRRQNRSQDGERLAKVELRRVRHDSSFVLKKEIRTYLPVVGKVNVQERGELSTESFKELKVFVNDCSKMEDLQLVSKEFRYFRDFHALEDLGFEQFYISKRCFVKTDSRYFHSQQSSTF